MKQAVVTQASPNSTGKQSFTNSIFSSDCKLAIFAATKAMDFDVFNTHAYFTVGATDKTSMSAVGFADDNIPTTDTKTSSRHSSSKCVYLINGTDAGLLEADLTGVSHPTTGVEINWTDTDTQEYVSALLLGGSDIEVKLISIDLTNASYTNVTANHGLSGTPDCLIIYGHTAGANSISTDGKISIGFYDGTNSACMAHGSDDAVANSAQIGIVRDDAVGCRLGTTGINYNVTVGSMGATSVGLTASAAPSSTHRYDVICIKGGASFEAKVGVFTTRTSGTGTEQVISGMGVAPTTVIFAPSNVLATNGVSTSNTGGYAGIGWAVNNNGTTQQFSTGAVGRDDYAVTDHWTRSRAANDACLLVANATASVTVVAKAAVGANDWESDGVSLTYSTYNATARYIPYLAFGAGTSVTISSAPSGLSVGFKTTISGTNFGASQGSGAVYLCPTDDVNDANREPQTIVSWSDTSITFTVTRGSLNYDTNLYLFVKENGGTSNASGSVTQLKAGVKLVRTV